MLVYFIITHACNYKCSFCIRKNLLSESTFVEGKDFVLAISKIKHIFPNSSIVITGGEPFLHPKWEQLLHTATANFSKVIITSNGSFEKDVAAKLTHLLKNNLFLQISIDGTEDVHNSIRGEGSYRKIIDNILFLKEVSNHVLLSTTVNTTNANCIKQLANILNGYTFGHWKVALEQSINPLSSQSLDVSDWNSLIDDFLPVCRFRVYTQKYFDFPLMDHYMSKGINSDEIIFNCGIGRSKIYVSPTFDILLCSCMNDTIGNLLSDSSETILRKLSDYSRIIPSEDSVCYNCKYKSICNGGCPGYSKKVFGVYNMGDIRCPLISKRNEKHKSFNYR